jgi:hypothetical protein
MLAGGPVTAVEVAMAEPSSSVQADVPKKHYAVEHRTWVRYPCEQRAYCQPVATDSGIYWPGKVQDISVFGLSLMLDRRFEPGTLLAVTLQATAEHCSQTTLVRVLHDSVVTAHPGLRWLVVCTFLRQLTERELQALLA